MRVSVDLDLLDPDEADELADAVRADDQELVREILTDLGDAIPDLADFLAWVGPREIDYAVEGEAIKLWSHAADSGPIR